VRGKALPAGDLEALARAWLGRLEGLPTLVIVNDRLDAALAAGAHGAHLGREDLPIAAARSVAPAGFLLGASGHDAAELRTAEAEGADYAGLGSFFPTSTKPDAAPLDAVTAGLGEPLAGLAIPVLGVGGVDTERAWRALAVPAVTGVAVSRAIQAAPDPAAAIDALRRAVDTAWAARGRA
jgi:thiamine-phosphate pyrophosphorylase